MVTIVNYYERKTLDGKVFFVLEVQGGIEMVMSQQTGSYYATAKKALIPSTFDESTCKGLVGTGMSGSIQRQECEPYEYTVKETGEILLLNHRWIYSQDDTPKSLPKDGEIHHNAFSNGGFSKNGTLQPA